MPLKGEHKKKEKEAITLKKKKRTRYMGRESTTSGKWTNRKEKTNNKRGTRVI